MHHDVKIDVNIFIACSKTAALRDSHLLAGQPVNEIYCLCPVLAQINHLKFRGSGVSPFVITPKVSFTENPSAWASDRASISSKSTRSALCSRERCNTSFSPLCKGNATLYRRFVSLPPLQPSVFAELPT